MAAPAAVFVYLSYLYLSLPDVRVLAAGNPPTTAFIELRARRRARQGKPPRRVQRSVRYERISSTCAGRCWSPRTPRSGITAASTWSS